MKALLLTLFIFTLPHGLAQKVGLNDLISKLDQSNIEIPLTNPKPFVKEISLRVSDDREFKEGDISFDARFKIDNYAEYNLKRSLYNNQKQRKDIIQKIANGDGLNQIIQLYTSLDLYRKKYKLLKDLQILLDDKVKVYRSLVKKGTVAPTQYLNAIENRDLNQGEIQRHMALIQSFVTGINSLLNTKYKVSDFKESEYLITTNQIKKKLKHSKNKSDSMSVKLARANVKRMKLERQLEIEEDNKILDFISVDINQRQFPTASEYENASVNDQRLGITLGLKVPVFDSNMARADNTIDSFMKKRKARTEYSDAQAAMISLKGEVQTLVQTVSAMEKSNAIKEAKRYLGIYGRRKGTSPLKILDISSFLIESELKLSELKSELYVKFYQYMYEVGMLQILNGKLNIKS